jgi:hypothetical protein
MLEAVADRVPGYKGRLGAYWYWQLSGGVLVTFKLGYRVTEQRWDVLRAEAVTARSGAFSAAEFPFALYGTLAESPPFIHDLDGVAEWSNRLYFQMGRLIDDASRWMSTLLAVALDPRIRPPSATPTLTQLQQDLVAYAVENLDGAFVITKLHDAHRDRVSKRSLSRLAREWQALGLLTERPRRVTLALSALAEQSERDPPA